MTYTITVAKSNLGDYHVSAAGRSPALIPLCGAKPAQRRRRAEDDAETLTEAARKWDNTVHPDLRCEACDKSLPQTT